MRSPVVWLCFGIVVLCALNVESKRSYHIVHGQTGPIFRSVVPTIGYTNVGPQFVGRRQQRQEEDEYDEVIDEEDEDEDEDEEYQPVYGSPFGGESPPIDYEDEDEEDEDGEEGEYGEEGEEGEENIDDEEFGERHDEVDNEVEGRQAYVNNQYIEEPYVHRQQRPQNNRVPVRTSNSRKPTKTKPSKHTSNKKKPSHGNKKKPSTLLADVKPQSVLTNKKKEPQSAIAMPETVVTTSPLLSTLKPSNPKQKLQLRPVATSTQFIATPVADLILRLSISLAKPIGQGNSTSFNVPVRIHEGVVKNVEESKVARADIKLPRTDKILAVTVSSVDKHPLKEDADVDEADEKDETADVPVTEMSRK